jgi:hypothetical protein
MEWKTFSVRGRRPIQATSADLAGAVSQSQGGSVEPAGGEKEKAAPLDGSFYPNICPLYQANRRESPDDLRR